MLGLGLLLAWKVVIGEMLSAFHLFNISATVNIYSSIPVLTPSNLWIYLYSFTLFIMKKKQSIHKLLTIPEQSSTQCHRTSILSFTGKGLGTDLITMRGRGRRRPESLIRGARWPRSSVASRRRSTTRRGSGRRFR